MDIGLDRITSFSRTSTSSSNYTTNILRMHDMHIYKVVFFGGILSLPE